MNQRYQRYAQYNVWANSRLIDMLLNKEPSIITQELVGSFSTIRETILHIWYAEEGWLSRLNDQGWQAQGVENFKGTHQELIEGWQATSQALHTFTVSADIESMISFERRGKQYTLPRFEIVQHVCNHSTYHRGQVVIMMRQLGIDEIAQTDYSEWLRIQYDAE